MKELLWRLVARIVSRPRVSNWLIRRSWRTPYSDIIGPDKTLYMKRWWLFNPYPPMDGEDTRSKLMRALPSVRIHYIRRPDTDRHLHDHPWNARTVVIDGWYEEERPSSTPLRRGWIGLRVMKSGEERDVFRRDAGYTGPLLFGQYHRISRVSPSGVMTLFITWKKQGTWGFEVDGRKVPWREYLGLGEVQ
ncbi:hypothetical protein [Ramlibacter sp.]|uniref:hypothetical protein n=1 Tax=Ramlibacter sp. TaxID=1917967 RepID=UPI003D0C0E86